MIGKILLFVYIVGISHAVLIDTEKHKDFIKTNPHAWQVVKVYHPPIQTHGYRYEPYTYPKYEFEYSVSDKKTGDHKHHHEARDGDQVRGEYSLVDSDGSLRKVQYHADDHSGFNAIVSKSVNMHGNHAVSVSDHTRFFYPVGHNIKINHYFPGKDYHYQDKGNPKNHKTSIPVHEVSTGANSDEGKMVLIESGNKLMVLEPVKIEKQSEESALQEVVPTLKAKTVADIPLQVEPQIFPVPVQNTEENKVNTEAANSEAIVEKAVELSPNESPASNESEKLEKDDQDSEGASSSFYHTNFYYVGY